jgi:hypothetical protein
VASSYRRGLAPIVDEFAALLDLQDACWAQRGRIAIDLGVAIALSGTYFVALPLLRRLRRERHEKSPVHQGQFAIART